MFANLVEHCRIVDIPITSGLRNPGSLGILQFLNPGRHLPGMSKDTETSEEVFRCPCLSWDLLARINQAYLPLPLAFHAAPPSTPRPTSQLAHCSNASRFSLA